MNLMGNFGDWIWNRCQNIKGNSDELILSYKFQYSLSRGDRGGDGAVEGENTTRRKVARTFSDMYTPLSFLFLFHSTNDKKGMYKRYDLNTQKFWILINNINTIASLFIMEKRKSFILFVCVQPPKEGQSFWRVAELKCIWNKIAGGSKDVPTERGGDPDGQEHQWCRWLPWTTNHWAGLRMFFLHCDQLYGKGWKKRFVFSAQWA